MFPFTVNNFVKIIFSFFLEPLYSSWFQICFIGFETYFRTYVIKKSEQESLKVENMGIACFFKKIYQTRSGFGIPSIMLYLFYKLRF